MKTEIKFRHYYWLHGHVSGKNPPEWVYRDYTLDEIAEGRWDSRDWEDSRYYTLKHRVQYTGLTDKNKKEIYADDIIEYSNGARAKVIFKDGAFCAYDGYATSSEEAYLTLITDDVPFMDSKYKFEVIGNIHENPELLELKRKRKNR